jgi:hypothetical protein
LEEFPPCEQEVRAVLHKARVKPRPIHLRWVTRG